MQCYAATFATQGINTTTWYRNFWRSRPAIDRVPPLSNNDAASSESESSLLKHRSRKRPASSSRQHGVKIKSGMNARETAMTRILANHIPLCVQPRNIMSQWG